MDKKLPRGLEISDDCRVVRSVAEGYAWQIYLMSDDSYLLAVKKEVQKLWIEKFGVENDIFMSAYNLSLIRSSKGTLISSFQVGPFPRDLGSCECAARAFNITQSQYPDADFSNAIFIEDQMLVLLLSEDKQKIDNGVIFGRWLTGGVKISIKDPKIKKFVSWMPDDFVDTLAELVSDKNCDNIEINNATKQVDTNSERNISQTDSGEFKLVGRPDLEKFFKENIIEIVQNREKYARMGIPFPGATILYGPPGCGKTYAVDQLAKYLGWKRFDIDASSIASPYIHETSKKTAEIFELAIKSAPSILVIDEMESFLTDRAKANGSGTHHVEEVAEFLRRIPEAISKGVLIFAMTNVIEMVDPAIRRRGRFDYVIEVKNASAAEIQALIESKIENLPIEKSVNTFEIAKRLEGRPLSDVAFIIREAGMKAARENKDMIDNSCFEQALSSLGV